MLILAEAIEQSGGKSGREDIEAGLEKVKDLHTPLGKFSFTPQRDAKHEPSVQQVKDGKFRCALIDCRSSGTVPKPLPWASRSSTASSWAASTRSLPWGTRWSSACSTS